MPDSSLITSEDAGTFPVFSQIQKVSHGFTLIELLIVIVIISIISTVTLYAFGDFGAGRKAKAAAEQFIVYTKLLEQQAILETKTFSLKINSTGYDTYFLDNASRWSPMPQRGYFHQQARPLLAPHLFPQQSEPSQTLVASKINRSFPLNGCRRFTRDIIRYPRNTFYFINNSIRHPA